MRTLTLDDQSNRKSRRHGPRSFNLRRRIDAQGHPLQKHFRATPGLPSRESRIAQSYCWLDTGTGCSCGLRAIKAGSWRRNGIKYCCREIRVSRRSVRCLVVRRDHELRGVDTVGRGKGVQRAGLLVMTLTCCGSHAHALEDSPGEILTNNGLKQVRPLYVLDTEAEAKKKNSARCGGFRVS